VARPKEFDPDAAVEAAMDLFWAEGYAATTPGALVEHLGIGRGSLYNTFHSKGALYQLALGHYRTVTTAMLREALDGEGSPAERLRRTVGLVVEASSSLDDRRGCLMTNAAIETAPRDAETAKVVAEVLEAQTGAFRAVIVEGQARGEIDPARDPDHLARYLVTFLNGIRVMQRASADPGTLRPLADLAVDAVLARAPVTD
jgi:TetR/AcrR family transcriptional repressor of nem operon